MSLAAVGLIAILSFGWLARSYFLSDDFTLLIQARAPWSWRGVFATRGGDGSFRPVGYLSYVISSRWAGFDPVPWHWIGFLLHAANAGLIYALAASLDFSRFSAWLGATIFALHGSHPEAVVWVAGRFDLLSTFFFLIAALLFVLSWRTTGGRRIFYECIAAVSMICAMLSKESAYSFPLVASLLVFCFVGINDRRMWMPVLGFFAITAALFVYRWTLLAGIGGYGGVSFAPSLKALALRLWGILFFPVNWSIPAGAELIAGAVIYVMALAWLFMIRADRSQLAFGIGFALLTAAPALTQLLIGLDLEKSRVLYLPCAGFCLIFAALFEPLHQRERIPVAAALILFHGVVLWHNLNGWQRASEVVEAACTAAAKCSSGSGQPVVTGRLPRTLHGVYTFANGFQECVAVKRAGAAISTSEAGECRFAWNATTESLEAIH